MAECVQEGCDGYRKSKKYGYCDAHLKRFLRGVDMSAPIKRYGSWNGGVCTQPDCDNQIKASGLCVAHYTQLLRGQELRPLKVTSLHNAVGYDAAHQRVHRLWGPAKDHPCVECGKRAASWAYDGTDPSEQLTLERNALLYSLFPEFYMPMCHKCHNRKDATAVSQELREYRILKHSTGLKFADIERLVKGS